MTRPAHQAVLDADNGLSQPVQSVPAATQEYFAEWLAGIPSDQWLLLWTLPDKVSYWHQAGEGPERFAQEAERLARESRQVYVSVAMATSPGSSRQRINGPSAAGIVGLWMD